MFHWDINELRIRQCGFFCLGDACLVRALSFQPKISSLGSVQGPSKEKVAILMVDKCDASVALQFGNEIGNYSCAAEGVQSSSKK